MISFVYFFSSFFTEEGIEARKHLHIDRLFPKDGMKFIFVETFQKRKRPMHSFLLASGGARRRSDGDHGRRDLQYDPFGKGLEYDQQMQRMAAGACCGGCFGSCR